MTKQGNNRRKVYATTLTAALAASAIVPAAVAADSGFPDMDGYGWATDSIDYLVGKGAIEGYPDGTYNPGGEITRGEAAKILAITLDLDVDSEAKADFEDAKDHWSSSYIAAIVGQTTGVIDGYEDETYRPDVTITRQELAKIIVNAYGLELNEKADIDFSDNNDWGAADVNVLASLGIVEGYENGTFKPGDKVSRAETPIFVHRTEVESKRLEVEEVVGEATVASVSAINATQVEVKFGVPVDHTTVFDTGNSGTLEASAFDFENLDPNFPLTNDVDGDASTGELSTDGKTLTITADAGKIFEGRYQIKTSSIKAKDGTNVDDYNEIVKFDADTTAPTILGTEKLNATTVKVNFSEPISSLGTVSYVDSNGDPVTGITDSFSPGDSEVIYNLTAATVPVNEEITVKYIGVTDQVNNVMSPNPATVTFQKGDLDGVAPTVSGITQTGAETFTVKFSEPVQKPAAADISVNGAPTTGTVKDVGTDSTTFEFTAAAVLDGASTVASVNPILDLSGESGTFSQVVTFVKDGVAPEITSTKVVQDASDGMEYLEITFDKDVKLSGTEQLSATGTYVKNYITETITAAGAVNNIEFKTVNNKKIVRVELATLLTPDDLEGAVYDLDLTLAGVTSLANEAVTTGETKFTRGADGPGSSAAVVKVASVAQGSNNNEVDVTFDMAVDGASATNPANYKVDGAVVKSVTLATGSLVATLKLENDSNTFSGLRNVTIENVKAVNAAVAMNKAIVPTSLDENVRPTVTAAKITATNKIELTFSENVTITGSANEFDVFIDGVSAGVATTATVAGPVGDNKVIITLTDVLTTTDLTKTITVKQGTAKTTEDIVTNKLNFNSIIAVQ